MALVDTWLRRICVLLIAAHGLALVLLATSATWLWPLTRWALFSAAYVALASIPVGIIAVGVAAVRSDRKLLLLAGLLLVVNLLPWLLVVLVGWQLGLD